MNLKTIYFQSRGFPEFRFLSNFHVAPFSPPAPENYASPVVYQTVEHYYQASKATNVNDFRHVMAAQHPAEAMRRGRLIKVPTGWELMKIDVMTRAVRMKFQQNKGLAEMLLATEGFELAEYAPWGDTFWGVGKYYVGENNLGKILMQIRDELKGNV